MITVEKMLEDEEFFFFFVEERYVAFFYLLSSSGDDQIWAVSGAEKPFAANTDDFSSYEDALKYIVCHLRKN
jgi:hypothetical protein